MEDSREITTSIHSEPQGEGTVLVMKLTHRPTAVSAEVRGDLGQGYDEVKRRTLDLLELSIMKEVEKEVGHKGLGY